MPRKYQSTEIFVQPDARYNSRELQKFINSVMHDGKKSKATAAVYEALDVVKTRFPEKDAIDVFSQAIDHVKPQLEVKSRRVGGANYQVPVEVRPRRARYLAFTWLLDAARARKGRAFSMNLADEISDAFNREGTAIKRREEMHRMADANRAFAHFAW